MELTEFSKMGVSQRKKAAFLLNIALNDLEMKSDGYGILDVNSKSGNTYLWFENYDFCLYMPISCDLKRHEILVNYSCPVDRKETQIELYKFKNLRDIEKWAARLSKNSRKKEGR